MRTPPFLQPPTPLKLCPWRKKIRGGGSLVAQGVGGAPAPPAPTLDPPLWRPVLAPAGEPGPPHVCCLVCHVGDGDGRCGSMSAGGAVSSPPWGRCLLLVRLPLPHGLDLSRVIEDLCVQMAVCYWHGGLEVGSCRSLHGIPW